MLPAGNNSIVKRTIAVVMAGVVLMAGSYFPVPVPVVKDLSVPFPCQANSCGCQNAAECWTSCRCHSDAEKIVWAKANQVTPPKWFVADLSEPACDSAEPSTTGNATSCCHCCCDAKPETEAAINENQEADPPLSRVVYLSLKQQRGCGGLDDDVVHVDVVLPIDAPVSEVQDFAKIEYQIFSDVAASSALSPPTPPPRAAYLSVL